MRLFLASLILVSSSAFACPNLTGIYNCMGGGPAGEADDIQKTVTQKIENGITTYEIKSQDLSARNPEATTTVEELVTNGSLRATTERNKQIIERSSCQKQVIENIHTVFEKGRKIEEFSFKFYKKDADLIIEAKDLLDPELNRSFRTFCRPVL